MSLGYPISLRETQIVVYSPTWICDGLSSSSKYMFLRHLDCACWCDEYIAKSIPTNLMNGRGYVLNKDTILVVIENSINTP